ncbi:DUF916 and DUF3324 domain-containing protein [Vagococcus hydrophili]|uniref:DUF916 and DUF3324 domain-containing protein n=1 Tax=Vagococcus hydrophili TaxID=2714947 RepID=A0A6G8ATV3_9ENTE|nr:DUF916 and DUF3324 domain-containing protein [Vagococcus hydrophili]QIL48399.1 DUF916 and DUF3324 domain-containing protein [Vagococcus hydrophili]
MRKKVKYFNMVLMNSLFFIFFFQGTLVEAGNNLITVYPVLPTNQIDKKLSYFDLKVKPGDEQKLDLILQNNDTKDKNLELEINPATTGASGNIVYTATNESKEKDTKVMTLPDIAKVKPKLKVKAGEEKKVTIEMKVPNTSFEGIILGGINIKEEAEKNEEVTTNAGLSPKFSHSIAIQLREGDKLPDPNIELKDVSAISEYGKNRVTLQLENTTPVLIDHLTYQAFVRKVGSKEVLIHEEQKDYRLAPNSMFDFKMDWNQDEIKAGHYLLNLVVTENKIKKDWSFEKEFIVSEEDANKFNAESVNAIRKKKKTKIIVVILVLVISALVAVTIYLFLKSSKKKSGRS